MAMSMSVPIVELLVEVLNVSKKAASIAKLIRDDREGIFRQLVEEKTGDAKNAGKSQDFKTLADVIIQETIRKDLGEKFPPILENILGEESNKFTNSVGETVALTVSIEREVTLRGLESALTGNADLARKITDVIHDDSVSCYDEIHECHAEQLSIRIPLQTLGIWIDPIDSTAEYIKGVDGAAFRHHGIVVRGLQTAVVLVGIFDRLSGAPLIGVVYEPFAERLVEDDPAGPPAPTAEATSLHSSPFSSRWRDRFLWGVCYGDLRVHSCGGAAAAPSSSPRSSFSFHSDRSSSSSLVPQKNSQHSSAVNPSVDEVSKVTSSAPSSAPPSLSTPSSLPPPHHKILLIGGGEDSRDQTLLPFRKEFALVRAAGAGYKLLCLCHELASVYLLTKPTTYRWDTCAPHAILKARGGNVFDLEKLTQRCRKELAAGRGGSGELKDMIVECAAVFELKYNVEEPGEHGAQRFKNGGGVLAVANGNSLSTALRPLLESSRCQSEQSNSSSRRIRSHSHLGSQAASEQQRSSGSQEIHPSERRSQSRQSEMSPPLQNSIASPHSGSSSSSLVDGFAKKSGEDAVAKQQIDVMIDMGDLLLPESEMSPKTIKDDHSTIFKEPQF